MNDQLVVSRFLYKNINYFNGKFKQFILARNKECKLYIANTSKNISIWNFIISSSNSKTS